MSNFIHGFTFFFNLDNIGALLGVLAIFVMFCLVVTVGIGLLDYVVKTAKK